MALTKRTYVDGETIITAQNLNDIQDEIIAHESNKVPITRTVNSKALSANITLSASDVGAVPTTRTVNSKTLSSNITLAAGDIGYNSSATYSASTVGKAISDLSGATNHATFVVTGTTVANKTNTTFFTSATDSRITASTNVANVILLDTSVISSENIVATTNANGTVTLSGTTSGWTTTAIIECYN